jgi:alpha-glucosidase (family GH31 glycosyl hydrolase)
MYKVYRYGGSLVYPLFFDFPNDDASFDNADSTFMIGDSIKVSPVLESGVTDEYEAYFP